MAADLSDFFEEHSLLGVFQDEDAVGRISNGEFQMSKLGDEGLMSLASTLHGTIACQRGLMVMKAWRQTYFGSIGNSGDGADMNDYDHDGLVNLTEFAFGLNPKAGGDGQLPVGQIIGGDYVAYFNHRANVAGITYGAEWSTSLLPTSWTAIPDTGIPPQHAFSVPVGSNKRMFLRHRISNP